MALLCPWAMEVHQGLYSADEYGCAASKREASSDVVLIQDCWALLSWVLHVQAE